MDFLAGEADVGDGGGIVLLENISMLIVSAAACGFNIAPLLRRVVLIGEAALGTSLDLKSIGLSAEGVPLDGEPRRLLRFILGVVLLRRGNHDNQPQRPCSGDQVSPARPSRNR